MAALTPFDTAMQATRWARQFDPASPMGCFAWSLAEAAWQTAQESRPSLSWEF